MGHSVTRISIARISRGNFQPHEKNAHLQKGRGPGLASIFIQGVMVFWTKKDNIHSDGENGIPVPLDSRRQDSPRLKETPSV